MKHFLVQFQDSYEPQETIGIYNSLETAERRIEKHANIDEDTGGRSHKYATIEEWDGNEMWRRYEYVANQKCPVFSFESNQT